MKCRRNPLSIWGAPMLAAITLAMLCSAAVAQETESPAAQPLATGTTPVTTAGGTVNRLAKFDAAADITSSQIFDNGTSVGIGNTAPAAKLDVSGAEIIRGLLTLPATGAATSAAGTNSEPVGWTASAFNSGTAAAVTQSFRLQAEPAGNDTAAPSGMLSLLYASGSAVPAETGLKISSKGVITFAAGQTFPGGGSFCIAVGGGFGPPSDGTTFVAPTFTVPGENKCTAWSGFTKTATTVILNTSGGACLSSTGKTLTVSVSSTDPEFLGTSPTSMAAWDYIQLTRASAAGSFTSGNDQGEFSGSANQITCTSSLLSLPDSHD
jgi:hypothetical protein